MKKIVFYVTIATGVILSSCLDDSELEKLRDQEIADLKSYLASKQITYAGTDTIYKVFLDTTLRDSTSKQINDTNFVFIDYDLLVVSSPTVIVETTKKGQRVKPVNVLGGPAYVSVKNATFYGIYWSLRQLQKGDTAEFVIPSDFALGSYGTSSIPPYSSIIFRVRVKNVVESPVNYDKQFWNRWVVDSLQLTLQDTTEDLPVYLKTIEEGNPNIPVETYTNATVIYRGWLADGRMFTNDFDTITYTVGSSNIISGFDKAIQQLHQGEHARFFIPYYRAYGKNGRNNSIGQVVIPPYSSLFYEVIIYKVGN